MLRTLVKDTAIYGLGDFIFKFIGFAIFPIYAHVFKVDEFGVMALVTTLAGLVAVLLNMGMNNAVQRFYWDPQTPEGHRPVLVSTGLWVLLTWSTLLTALVLLLLSPLRIGIQQRFDVLWIFILLSLVSNIPSEILQYSLNILRLHFSPWLFTLVSAWRNLAGVLLGLFWVLILKKGLLGFFWGNFLGLVVAIPLGFWLIRKDLRFEFDKQIAKEIMAFGYPFIFTGLAYWVFGSMDRWMLGGLSNNTEVGLYSIASKFATILIFFNTAIGQAWSPFAMKLLGEDPDYRLTFSKVLSALFLGLVLIGFVVSLFGLEMLRLTTPAAYWPAANTLSVLAMGIVLAGTTQVTALGISIGRRTQLFATGSWIAAILNLLLNWLMIPKWGALGAGLATFVSYFFLSGFYLYWTQRIHPIPLQVKALLLSLALLFFSLASSFYLNGLHWSVGILFSKIILSSLVICAVGTWVILKAFKPSELSRLLPWKKGCV